MTLQFAQRLLDYRFDFGGLGPGGQGPPFESTLILNGLRSSAQVNMIGEGSFGTADLTIYGMRLQDMNQLSTLGTQVQLVGRNFATVFAGDVTGMTQVFQGTIQSAWFDGDGAPNAPFRVIAKAGLLENMVPVPASSFPTGVNVAAFLEQIAGQMGLKGFSGPEVNVTLPPSYFPGTGLEQVRRACEAAGLTWTIDNGVLVAWPRDTGSRGDSGVTLTPTTGLVGYPRFTANGVMATSLFNPAIAYGTLVTIAGSSLPEANAQWKVVAQSHELASLVPNGHWFTVMQLIPPQLIKAPIGQIR